MFPSLITGQIIEVDTLADEDQIKTFGGKKWSNKLLQQATSHRPTMKTADMVIYILYTFYSLLRSSIY